MPVYDNVMEKLVRGNDRDVTRDVSGLPTGVTLTDAWLTVQAPNGSSQLFEKHITTALVAGQGQIEDAGAGDQVGRLRFEMTATNTLLCTGGTNDTPANHPYAILCACFSQASRYLNPPVPSGASPPVTASWLQ